MKIELNEKQHQDLVESLNTLARRYELDATALASIGTDDAKDLADRRLSDSKTVWNLFWTISNA